MSIKFPYRYKFVDFGKIVDPLVDLEVETSRGWQEVRFLIDSGADATTLPLSLAGEWGIKIDRSQRVKIGGVEGRGVYGYPAEITIRIGEEELGVRCYFIESETIPLLGRTDIFDKFSLIFDNKNKEVVFEKTEEEECWLTRLVKRLNS